MSISSRAIERPVAVTMLFAAIIFLGLISFQRLPIDLLPEIAYPKLVIYTNYPDVAPAEVERLITEKIEQYVGAVPGVERVESVSREGTSLVTLRFAWGTDMDFAALNVRERLDHLGDILPPRAGRPVVFRTDPNAEPIMALSVAGQNDLWALKDLAESVFKRRLEQIEGIAQAAITGGLEREIRVEIDPARLESFGLTIDDVEAALQAANASAPGGTVRRGRYRYALRTLGELEDVEEIGRVAVKRQGGTGMAPGATTAPGGPPPSHAPIALADLARVEDGFKERESMARYNGTDAIGLLLFKESGANTVRVAERVEDVLDELRTEYPTITVDVAMSQAEFVSEAIDNVVEALVQGGILAFLVLFLFLRDARYPIAISLAIPISVIATFAMLDAVGVSLNIMSLGGLALGVGMLVDNSIVVLENISRHRDRGLAVTAAAALGADEVRAAITSSTLTTIAVFVPIIYVGGIAGELFGALSYAVGFSLLASLLVALTLVPTMAAQWHVRPARSTVTDQGKPVRNMAAALIRGVSAPLGPLLDAFDRGFERFTATYLRALDRALDHRGRVVGIGALLLVIALALGAGLDRSVLPDVDQGALRIRIELPQGTPIEETALATTRVETILRADPDVDAIFTRVGRQDAITGASDEGSGLNTAVVEVRLRKDAKSAALLERLRPRLAEFPTGMITVETGQATALGTLLGSAEADLTIRVRGDDLDRAHAYARELEARLAAAPELTNVRIGTELGQPEIQVEIDRERAAAFGIEPQRIAQTIEKYMLGTRATDFVDFDRKVPIIVLLPEAERRSITTFDLLKVDGIPLRELVRTREATGPTEIRRVDQGRLVPVYADGVGGSIQPAITAAKTAISTLPPPPGIRVEIGGENEELSRNFRDLVFAFVLAILLVYMILAAEFESLLHPFTILLSVPLAIVGAVAALWITGMGINSMSLIGMVILVGIVVNNAIVLVDFITSRSRAGLPTREAILEAGRARLRPILMTTMTTLLGVSPMALGFGAGADLRAPLAITIFGGLFSATLLTLVVVPVAYDLIEELATTIRGTARLPVAEGAIGERGAASLTAPEVPTGD